jgi:DNA-binding NarL/FixJ family response regulator
MNGNAATRGQPYALVVDDHPLVARGMAEYLLTHCGFAAVHTAARNIDAVACIDGHGSPELAVVDFWLPGGTALALLRQLSHRCPRARLLVVSGDDASPGLATRAYDAGAHGFLYKHEPAEVFARVVAALRAGQRWCAPAPAVPAPAGELPVRASDLGLTGRQGQVLAMMLRGLPNKRIAQALGLSEPTVKEHVSAVLARLGVSNRVEAIMLLRGRHLEP